MTFVVQDAEREKLIGAVALTGPSGSGKTLGGLLLGFGMMKAKYPDLEDQEIWKKVGFLDTEHRRALIYANREKAGIHIGKFKYLELTSPYTVDRYIAASKALIQAGAEVIICDSLTHAWEADGGLLDLQQEKGGNYQAWRKVNPTFNKLVQLTTGELLQVHMINCIRSKQKHEVTTDEDNKLKIAKLGLQPIMRDSFEYELQVSLNLGMSHRFESSKDNTDIFEGRHDFITVEDGMKLYHFLEEGRDVKAEEKQKRLEKLQYINTLRENNEQLEFFAKDIEQKTGMSIADMVETKPGWFDGSYKRINAKAEELNN